MPSDAQKAQVDLRLAADSVAASDKTRLRINGQDYGALPKTLSLKKGRYFIEVHGPEGKLWTHMLQITSLESIALEANFPATVQTKQTPSDIDPADVTGPAQNAAAYNAQPVNSNPKSTPSSMSAKSAATNGEASFSVEGAPIGAEIVVDGSVVGTLPLEETPVASGIHTINVQHPGSKTFTSTVYLKDGEYKTITAILDPNDQGLATSKIQDKPTPPTKQHTKPEPIDIRGLSSHGAQLVPLGHFTMELSTGFPNFINGRLNAGFFENGPIGLDGGVELRSFFTMTEGNVFTRLRLMVFQPFALAVSAAAGGGGGPKSRSTFFGRVGLLGSMFLRNMITLTGKIDLNMYSDRYCPSSAAVNGQAEGCNLVSGAPLHRNRYNRARIRLSGIFEFAFSANTSLMLMIQGTPFQHERHLYTSAVSTLMPSGDLKFYSGIGAVFKY